MNIHELIHKQETMKLTSSDAFSIRSSYQLNTLPNMFFHKAIESGSHALLRQVHIPDANPELLPIVRVRGVDYFITEFRMRIYPKDDAVPTQCDCVEGIVTLVNAAMEESKIQRDGVLPSSWKPLPAVNALRVVCNIFNTLCLDTPDELKSPRFARNQRIFTLHTERVLLHEDGECYIRFAGSNERVLEIKTRVLHMAKERAERRREKVRKEKTEKEQREKEKREKERLAKKQESEKKRKARVMNAPRKKRNSAYQKTIQEIRVSVSKRASEK